jgi:Cu/Zn superoxide dismutase
MLAATCAGVMLGSALLSASPASAAGSSYGGGKAVHTHAKLRQLNKSGVSGSASVTVRGTRLDVSLHASGLLAKAPHAVHIHYGEQARHECPTLRDDTNGDRRLTTLEGVPAYGPVAVSLTTKGDTTPASALAVDRFSKAPKGKLHYHRHVTTDKTTAAGIRDGEAVVVVHGVDHNHNGSYDFGAGKSDLDPKLPAEATNPAACGVLRR